MNRIFLAGILGLSLIGCTTTVRNTEPANPGSTKQAEASNPKENIMKITPPDTDQAQPTHVVLSDTPYYRSGPQQSRPPEGTLKAGTRVSIEQRNGSYIVVRTIDNISGYIPAEAVSPIE